jgi:spore coat protein U-like protein
MPRARLLLLALAAGGALLAAAPAQAGCAISTTGVAFGAYDPQSPAPLLGAGRIDMRCSDDIDSEGHGGGDKKIELSTGHSGSYATREMRSGSSSLDYNLYTDASRTGVWGDGRHGTDSVKVHPEKSESLSVNVYGRIPAGQNVRAGTYTDTLIVTIEF